MLASLVNLLFHQEYNLCYKFRIKTSEIGNVFDELPAPCHFFIIIAEHIAVNSFVN